VGTSTVVGTAVVRRLSFNLFAGYTAGLAGFELGGLGNVESAFACGVQVAGLGNIVVGPVEGVQITTGVNFGRGLRGVQLGIVDVVSGEVRGTQVGLVNVASGEVKGAQIGLVNVAERSTFSLGFVSVVRRGRLHLDLWGQESGMVMAGVKHGGDHFHNVYGVGVRPVGDGGRWAFTFGLGGHLPLSDRFFLDLDTLGYSLHDAQSFRRVTWIAQERLLIGLRVIKPLAVYLGPSFDVSFSPRDLNPRLSPYTPWVFAQSENLVVQGWVGGILGMQVL
jgi:hypothetical protein